MALRKVVGIATVSFGDEDDVFLDDEVDFLVWEVLGVTGVKTGEFLEAEVRELEDFWMGWGVGVKLEVEFLRIVFKLDRGGDLTGGFGVTNAWVDVVLGLKDSVWSMGPNISASSFNQEGDGGSPKSSKSSAAKTFWALSVKAAGDLESNTK